jgi:hypothetical protein
MGRSRRRSCGGLGCGIFLVATLLIMINLYNMQRKFSNHRQWRDFISAIQESVTYPCSVTYPKIITALRSAHPCGWLGVAEDLSAPVSLER